MYQHYVPKKGNKLGEYDDGNFIKYTSKEANNYNRFYNDSSVGSSITAVLNQEPSLVKIFNTLNYEGSQSKINAYEVDPSTNISNMEYYNLEQDKPGWYIKSIETDKQKGSVNEFIEKEGKWFNYIRGDVNEIKTSDLSFQGLGIIESIDSVNSGNGGNASGGSNGANGGNGGQNY